VGADWMGPDNGDAENDEGARPGSMRPGSMRPGSMRPGSMRPGSMRPGSMRPGSMRPGSMRPGSMRPGSMRPGSMRPDESGDEPPDGWLDPDEWSADLADLFYERSAVLRLGGRLVFGEDEINVPTLGEVGPRYLTQPEVTGPKNYAPRLAVNEEKPEARLSFRRLKPRDHELGAKVVLPNRLVTDVVADPELAWALKDDLARALVLAADRAFLNGSGGAAPVGIMNTTSVPNGGAEGDLLLLVRLMLQRLRLGGVANFRSPGWVLDPETLNALCVLTSGDGLSQRGSRPALDVGVLRLVAQDGADGGVLLGYPFVVSRAAREQADGPARIFFASDWSEAWIGVRSNLIAIDVSTEAHFQSDETVIRAVMQHDFAVRRPGCFIHGTPA
jgi:HK97 family phage major capsid protein